MNVHVVVVLLTTLPAAMAMSFLPPDYHPACEDTYPLSCPFYNHCALLSLLGYCESSWDWCDSTIGKFEMGLGEVWDFEVKIKDYCQKSCDNCPKYSCGGKICQDSEECCENCGANVQKNGLRGEGAYCYDPTYFIHLCIQECPECLEDSDCTSEMGYSTYCHLGECIEPISMPYEGRPFTVGEVARATISEVSDLGILNQANSWKTLQAVSLLERNSTYNREVGLRWIKQAEGEHASVASFARHTLQLMSLGAPSELLMASQAASIDEIKHAKMCYGLGSLFLEQEMVPGVLDIENSLEGLDVKEIVQSVIQEGCVEETLAAIEAHYREYLAQDPDVKATLKEIAEDETRHAKLAWDTVNWITKKYPEHNSFVEKTFDDQLERQQKILSDLTAADPSSMCPDQGKDGYLERFGFFVSSDQEKIRRFGMEKIIRPTFESGNENFGSIFDQIMNLDVSLI